MNRFSWISSLLKLAACFTLAIAGLVLLFARVTARPAARLNAPTVTCATNISANINNSVEWNTAGSPYCVNSQITLASAATLTIDPGVTVYFATGAALNVSGSLLANGSDSQGIVFTAKSDAPTPGFWRWININSGGNASFNHADISYAGYGSSYAINIAATNVQVRNTHIHDTTGIGIRIWGNNLAPLIEDTRIDHNTGTNGLGITINGDGNTPTLRRLLIEDNSSFPLQEQTGIGGHSTNMPVYDDLTFSGNSQDVFLFQACTMDISRTIDAQTEFNGAPVQINAGSLGIKTGVILTLTAGTTLQFNTGSGSLNIPSGGKVVGVGTEELPVRVTSSKAVPQPGDWRQISVSPGGHLKLAYCEVSYGGQADNNMLQLAADDIQIDHCRIHHARAVGIRIHGFGGHPLSLTNSSIDHNGSWAIVEYPGGDQYRVPTYANLTLQANGHDALALPESPIKVDRTLDGPGMLNGKPFVIGYFSMAEDTTLTITPGTILLMEKDGFMEIYGDLNAQGTPAQPIVFTSNLNPQQPGDWSGIAFGYHSNITLAHCEIGYAGKYGFSVGLTGDQVDLRQCVVHHSGGDGIRVFEDIDRPIENIVVSDSEGSGLRIDSGTTFAARHLTLKDNQAGVQAVESTLHLTNTILADSDYGAVSDNGNIHMIDTLWDSVITPTSTSNGGVFNEVGHINGKAKFLFDGTHIACSSDAVSQGLPVSSSDLDGEARPQPASSLPDLGADESPCGDTVTFVAHKYAYHPQWLVDLQTLSGRLFQEYLIDFFYGGGGGGAALEVEVTDTLSTELSFASQSSSLPAVFEQQGQELTWDLQNPLAVGSAGFLHLEGDYESLEVGDKVVNHAMVDAGGFHETLAVTTTLDYLFPPLLISAGDGETCYGKNTITGMGMPELTARLVVNSAVVSETTISTSGLFTFTYQYVSQQTEAITARVCSSSLCSPDSQIITFTPQKTFWCPRETTLKYLGHAFKFHNGAGLFDTSDARVIFPLFHYPGEDPELDLAVGEYPVPASSLTSLRAASNRPSAPATTPPDEIYIDIGGYHYYPADTHFPPDFSSIIYTFHLTGAYIPPGGCTGMTLYARYGDLWVTSVLTPCAIDPDGTVFDVTEGFDPDDPTVNAISGVTVTCMMSMPEWGGWVPWPAALYDDQENPQVTSSDGYFAFFTPPGKYYLKVNGTSGYQDWRSPEIEVISEVVHINVPLTPWTSGAASQVQLTSQGASPSVVAIPTGGIVEWLSTLDPGEAALSLLEITANPFLHPLSTLNPQTDTLGFDGGMLAPGALYRRQFNTAGTYTYTDGAGSTHTILVGGTTIYLPVAYRR